MDVNDKGSPQIGQRIILTRSRRLKNINDNLNKLEQSTMKKKIAQDLYYKKQPMGQSPLFKENLDKGSVHERLGEVKVMEIAKQNKVVILNRSKFRWKPRVEGIFTRKYRNAQNQRPRLKNQAQKRLENCRQNMRSNYPFARKRPIHLKRHNYLITNPENIRFEVKNNVLDSKQHSVQNSLDRIVQMNIKLVQMKRNTIHTIPNATITSSDFGFTKVNLNERFSCLP